MQWGLWRLFDFQLFNFKRIATETTRKLLTATRHKVDLTSSRWLSNRQNYFAVSPSSVCTLFSNTGTLSRHAEVPNRCLEPPQRQAIHTNPARPCSSIWRCATPQNRNGIPWCNKTWVAKAWGWLCCAGWDDSEAVDVIYKSHPCGREDDSNTHRVNYLL